MGTPWHPPTYLHLSSIWRELGRRASEWSPCARAEPPAQPPALERHRGSLPSARNPLGVLPSVQSAASACYLSPSSLGCCRRRGRQRGDAPDGGELIPATYRQTGQSGQTLVCAMGECGQSVGPGTLSKRKRPGLAGERRWNSPPRGSGKAAAVECCRRVAAWAGGVYVCVCSRNMNIACLVWGDKWGSREGGCAIANAPSPVERRV